MQKVNFRNLNGQGITMAAVIHVPADLGHGQGKREFLS